MRPMAPGTVTLCGSLSMYPVGLGRAMHEAGHRALGLPYVYVPFGIEDVGAALGGNCLGRRRRARRGEASRRQGAPAPACRSSLHVPLSGVWGAHDAALPACPLRALQGHLRVARVARVPEILAAHAARPHPPRSRRARCSHRHEHADRACVLLGIVATCRAQGVPAQAHLAWALESLGTHRDVFALPLEAMTPAAFKKTLG